MTNWWHDPEPEPDGWTRGEILLYALLVPAGALVAVVVVWWLETMFMMGE